MTLAIASAAAIVLGLGWSSTTRADGYHLHPTIPPTVAAYNYTTGGEFMAPPVPYGHYAKSHAFNKNHVFGCVSCRLHALLGGQGTGCGSCGGKGCGLCSGGGLFGHGGAGSACSGPGCDGGKSWGHHAAAGKFAPADCGPGCLGHGATAVPVVAATNQAAPPAGMAVVQPTSQYPCGQSGCGIASKHSHGKGLHKSLCGGCHGRGCGSCGGAGMTGGCGDPGCGLCKGTGCGLCGGKGCSHCLSKLHGKLSSLTGWLHRPQKVDYFLGAGGPVPLTPGYVPYVNVTRSPRDFFAFPPMNPMDP